MSESNSSSGSSTTPNNEHHAGHAEDVEFVQGLLRTLMEDATVGSPSPRDAARVEIDAAQYVLHQLRSQLSGGSPTMVQGPSGNMIELVLGDNPLSSDEEDEGAEGEEVDEVDDDMDEDADDAVDGDVVNDAMDADAWETDEEDDPDYFPPLTEEQIEDLEELEDDEDGFFHRTMDERWDYIDNNDVRIPSSSLVRHPQQPGVQVRYGGDFGPVCSFLRWCSGERRWVRMVKADYCVRIRHRIDPTGLATYTKTWSG